MLTAARCITNLLEAMPRSHPIVIDAVPYLLEKVGSGKRSIFVKFLKKVTNSVCVELFQSVRLFQLKRIECIDVAEQSLCALEELSKKNNAKAILTAVSVAYHEHRIWNRNFNFFLQGGIAACISHVDFFSMSSQRLAFSIASNCALYLTASEFHLVR